MLLSPEQAKMMRELQRSHRAAIIRVGTIQTKNGPPKQGSWEEWSQYAFYNAVSGNYSYNWYYERGSRTSKLVQGVFITLRDLGYAELTRKKSVAAPRGGKQMVKLTAKGWAAFELLREIDTESNEPKPIAVKTDADPFMQRFACIMG